MNFQEDWKKIRHKFPGWSEEGRSYFDTSMSWDYLGSQIGRQTVWLGKIVLCNDGYHGQYARRYGGRKGLASAFGLTPASETIFVFSVHDDLESLLLSMENWLDVRRSPSTWVNGLSQENKKVLSLAKEVK